MKKNFLRSGWMQTGIWIMKQLFWRAGENYILLMGGSMRISCILMAMKIVRVQRFVEFYFSMLPYKSKSRHKQWNIVINLIWLYLFKWHEQILFFNEINRKHSFKEYYVQWWAFKFANVCLTKTWNSFLFCCTIVRVDSELC